MQKTMINIQVSVAVLLITLLDQYFFSVIKMLCNISRIYIDASLQETTPLHT